MSETLEITGGEAIARMFAAHDVGLMFGMGGFRCCRSTTRCGA